MAWAPSVVSTGNFVLKMTIKSALRHSTPIYNV